jgi:hypothetical protein
MAYGYGSYGLGVSPANDVAPSPEVGRFATMIQQALQSTMKQATTDNNTVDDNGRGLEPGVQLQE